MPSDFEKQFVKYILSTDFSDAFADVATIAVSMGVVRGVHLHPLDFFENKIVKQGMIIKTFYFILNFIYD